MPPSFQTVDSSGCKIRVAVEGEGPLVLMVHGWPESWYSWRHQMGPIAAAGYKAAAIDVRGYGGSDKPHAVEAYAMETIVGDIQAVADELGGGKAILVGHDWGAPIVWSSAVVDPARFRAVAGLSIPYMGKGKAPFIDIARQLFTDNGLFFYQIYFQDEGVVEAEVEADMRTALRKIYYSISGDAPAGAWPLDKKHGAPLLVLCEAQVFRSIGVDSQKFGMGGFFKLAWCVFCRVEWVRPIFFGACRFERFDHEAESFRSGVRHQTPDALPHKELARKWDQLKFPMIA